MSWQAYADESVRGQAYMMCVTWVASSEIRDVRKRLRALTSPGQRRVHFSSESDRRRRALLREMGGLGTVSVIYIARARDQVAARAAILTTVVGDLLAEGVTRFVLESRAAQDRRDRLVISRAIGPGVSATFTYAHSEAHGEPLLWVPDAVAWAWGRDRRWKKIVRDLQLVTGVRHIDVN